MSVSFRTPSRPERFRQLVFVAICRYFMVRLTSMNIIDRNAIGRISSFLYLRPTRCD